MAGLVAVPLKLQQLAVNELAYDKTFEELIVLCTAYLLVVLLNAALKFFRDYRMRVLGESTVRWLRVRLYQRHVSDVFEGCSDKPEKGTLLSMIASDAEEVGKFAGSAIAEPLFMIGTLVSVLGFIAVQQPMLGVVALLIILPQAAIVLAVQKKIKQGVKRRVQLLRGASDSIHGSDFRQVDQAILDDFSEIFEARRSIVFLKLSSKGALRVLNSIGTVAVLFLGGWLVLQGRTDIGTVVAALAGLTKISGPWIELVAFYRSLSAIQVRFEMIVDKVFDPKGEKEIPGGIQV